MLKTSTILHLPDGRDMCWCEYGAPGGEPVIMIHGTPLCRTMWEEFSDTAENKNVRIIAPDRPGYGYSDYNIKDNLVYFPSDIECLMEHLAIDTCSICGVSGGSPYALMCALKIPGRIKNAVIVSGAGPYVKEAIGEMNANKAVYNIGKKLPGLLSLNNYIFVTKFLEKTRIRYFRQPAKRK